MSETLHSTGDSGLLGVQLAAQREVLVQREGPCQAERRRGCGRARAPQIQDERD
jgi:hypothetical protein